MNFKKIKIRISSERAFTLIELLAVIAVVGLFATVVFGSFSASRASARDYRRLADIKEMQIGLALYYDKYRIYPSSTGNIATDLNVLVTEGNLPSIPTNPQSTAPAYEYKVVTIAAGRKFYCIGAKMEKDPSSVEGFASACDLTSSPTSVSYSGDLWYKATNPK